MQRVDADGILTWASRIMRRPLLLLLLLVVLVLV